MLSGLFSWLFATTWGRGCCNHCLSFLNLLLWHRVNVCQLLLRVQVTPHICQLLLQLSYLLQQRSMQQACNFFHLICLCGQVMRLHFIHKVAAPVSTDQVREAHPSPSMWTWVAWAGNTLHWSVKTRQAVECKLTPYRSVFTIQDIAQVFNASFNVSLV